jgi:hypothetical protein
MMNIRTNLFLLPCLSLLALCTPNNSFAMCTLRARNLVRPSAVSAFVRAHSSQTYNPLDQDFKDTRVPTDEEASKALLTLTNHGASGHVPREILNKYEVREALRVVVNYRPDSTPSSRNTAPIMGCSN